MGRYKGQGGGWEMGKIIISVMDFPFTLGKKIPSLWFFVSEKTGELRTYEVGKASQGVREQAGQALEKNSHSQNCTPALP